MLGQVALKVVDSSLALILLGIDYNYKIYCCLYICIVLCFTCHIWILNPISEKWQSTFRIFAQIV